MNGEEIDPIAFHNHGWESYIVRKDGKYFHCPTTNCTPGIINHFKK